MRWPLNNQSSHLRAQSSTDTSGNALVHDVMVLSSIYGLSLATSVASDWVSTLPPRVLPSRVGVVQGAPKHILLYYNKDFLI